eukprot:m.87808 g.87808  ORF g.87808 m.87808 type:complete len:1114 (+) comp12250_c0_seq2:47-3388(+)
MFKSMKRKKKGKEEPAPFINPDAQTDTPPPPSSTSSKSPMKKKKESKSKQDTSTSSQNSMGGNNTITPQTLADLNMTANTSAEITAYKAKYLGVVRVEGPSGRHIVGSAFLRVNAQKDVAVKVFLVVREKVLLVIHRKQNDVLINVALVHVTFTEKNPVNNKQFCIICEDPQRGYFCHVFQTKDKHGKTLDVIEQAVAQQRALAVSRVATMKRQQSLRPQPTAQPNRHAVNRPNTLTPKSTPNIPSVGQDSNNPIDKNSINTSSSSSSTTTTMTTTETMSSSPQSQFRRRTGSLSARSGSLSNGAHKLQQQQQQQRQQRQGSMSVRPRTASFARHGSVSAVPFDASKPLPKDGYAFRGVYLGHENVLEIAGSKVCMSAVKRNAQRWQTVKQKKKDADGKNVSILVRSHSVETMDRSTGDVVFGDFTKIISFTCVARRTPNYEIFTYIRHDERLKRTVCHIYRVAPSIGDDICGSIGKAFEILREVDQQRGANPFAVTDPERQPVHGHLFGKQIHRSDLKAITHIGAGQFGDVYLAKQVVKKGEGEDGGNTIRRAVKMLRGAATDSDKQEFMHEVNVMCELPSENLVGFVGVALQQKPWLCVLEYLKYGDLKSVLVACEEKGIALHVAEVLYFARQLAGGMAFLASKRFVHMDLAARNCLVTDHNVVKVGDFGLTQRLDEGSDHFVLRRRLKLALKWIAIEGLDQKIFSEQSDVWSFGIVMWEMFEYGQLPYPSVQVQDTQKRVRAGLRCDQPKNCPDSVFAIMKKCWMTKRESRWTFRDLECALLDEIDCHDAPPQRDIGATIANMRTELDPVTEATSTAPRRTRSVSSNSLSSQRKGSLARNPSTKPKMHASSVGSPRPVVTLNSVTNAPTSSRTDSYRRNSTSDTKRGSINLQNDTGGKIGTSDTDTDTAPPPVVRALKPSLFLDASSADVSDTDTPPPRPPKTTSRTPSISLAKQESVADEADAPPPRPPKSTKAKEQQEHIDRHKREKNLLQQATTRSDTMHLSKKAEKALSLKRGTSMSMFSRPKEEEHSRIFNALNPKPLWFQTVQEKREQEEDVVEMGDVLTVEHPRNLVGGGFEGLGVDFGEFDDGDESDDSNDDEDDDDPTNLV